MGPGNAWFLGCRPILLERNEVDLPLKARRRRRATTVFMTGWDGCTGSWTLALYHLHAGFEACDRWGSGGSQSD
ncbi:hypothetical protein HBH98_097050 [Parastagonospora nodorum]|nr:hypothetical protein HBH49_142230 [Parastagonospora nodorum]KAH4067916.1 hypothetical protein HBH50_133670 [Parastagonospora nodorum]KAH4087015.1 hypothetical protein HBH48_143080 [Parastagonospora nodorum]KAH4171060.1 hypothetical protein HBH43_106980 [Parastagonospora nodorum]KAH4191472.1 hypothetical protein HBH42_125810 [Parastagonospora nodorum]